MTTFDPDEAYRTVCAADTPTRERVVLALDLLGWLARHGDLTHPPAERSAVSAVCEAVVRADLDCYQSLLTRMAVSS